MIRHFLTWQFVSFLAVGGFAALLHWLARIVFSLWLPFALAVACAYGVGMAAAFVLNSLFVFPNSDRSRRQQIRDFVLINLAFFPVVWLASVKIDDLLLALNFTWQHEALAHALAISLPMLATFLIYKFFAFRETRA